jgi:acyl-CoA thioesterase-1
VRTHLSPLRLSVALALAIVVSPVMAETVTPMVKSSACTAPADITRLAYALPRTARRLAAGEPLTIVALGSSSTGGAGASSPAASYPAQLVVELRARFPGRTIQVLNKGVNGEDAREMLARFEESVIAEHPDLVLWQVGTNSLLLDRPLNPAGDRIRDGLSRMKALGIDVVLIDAQFAPKVLAKPDVGNLMDLYGAISKQEGICVFHRFAVMRYWHEVAGLPFNTFLSPDELHMNDWSYGCIAKLLAGSIVEAATRSTLTAGAGTPKIGNNAE